MPEPAPPVAPPTPEADDPGPRTLSGRPVIDVSAEPPRTRVGPGTLILAVLFGLAVVAAVVLVVVRRGPAGTDVRSMVAGQCYVETDVVTEDGRSVPYGSDTPCLSVSPRIVAVIPLPVGPYPGDAGFDGIVRDHCGGEANIVVAPTAGTWLDGDRTVVCIDLPEV